MQLSESLNGYKLEHKYSLKAASQPQRTSSNYRGKSGWITVAMWRLSSVSHSSSLSQTASARQPAGPYQR